MIELSLSSNISKQILYHPVDPVDLLLTYVYAFCLDLCLTGIHSSYLSLLITIAYNFCVLPSAHGSIPIHSFSGTVIKAFCFYVSQRRSHVSYSRLPCWCYISQPISLFFLLLALISWSPMLGAVLFCVYRYLQW